MFPKRFLLVIVFLSCVVFPPFSKVRATDAFVVIYQSTLNKFLSAIGPVDGQGEFNAGLGRLNYNWVVDGARIDIEEDTATFKGDVAIKAGPIRYGTEAKGRVNIVYDGDENIISVQIENASFELYAKVFGNKIHITDVDISPYYKPKFTFAGPQPIQSEVSVDLPNGQKKKISIEAGERKLRLAPGKIIVTTELNFSS
jgi:hypothetical protein